MDGVQRVRRGGDISGSAFRWTHHMITTSAYRSIVTGDNAHFYATGARLVRVDDGTTRPGETLRRSNGWGEVKRQSR